VAAEKAKAKATDAGERPKGEGEPAAEPDADADADADAAGDDDDADNDGGDDSSDGGSGSDDDATGDGGASAQSKPSKGSSAAAGGGAAASAAEARSASGRAHAPAPAAGGAGAASAEPAAAASASGAGADAGTGTAGTDGGSASGEAVPGHVHVPTLGNKVYTAMRLCFRCGMHVHRSNVMTCTDCHRDFCGLGGRSIHSPVGIPCVEIYRCNCNNLQCHDCYVANTSRSPGLWLHCIECDSMMCPREWESKSAGCRHCQNGPLCKPCRPKHTKTCAALGEDSDAGSDEDDEGDDDDEEDDDY
jgi:hypothetical protein